MRAQPDSLRRSAGGRVAAERRRGPRGNHGFLHVPATVVHVDPVIRREPKEPEENGPLDEYGFEPVERGYEPIQPASPWRDMLRKFWAPIALVGFVLWKFKAAFAAIFKLKLFTVVGSAFVSVAAYALIWGWQFGLGFVLLLFVHELGHVAVAKYQGLPVSAPVFIPFMGALILMKEMPQNAWREAQIALGGPILGALGAAACWGLGEAMDSDLLVALAYVGFFLNLFNLIPVLPLDGGRAIGAVHPVFWVLGAAVLVVAAVLVAEPRSAGHRRAARRLRALRPGEGLVAEPRHPWRQPLLRDQAVATRRGRRRLRRAVRRARARHGRDADSPGPPVTERTEDVRILERCDPDIEKHVAMIADEFRQGFLAVESIGPPA